LSTALEAAYLIDRLDRLTRSGGSIAELNPAQWEALRYLSRANRFSRTPAALAGYVGSTRGTISQTLIALEQKGLASRQSSHGRRCWRVARDVTGHPIGNDRAKRWTGLRSLPHMQAFPPQCQTGQRLAASLQFTR
jgi:DNA-binding MarR family transcriptional regulator